ncbi:MFS transporter [Pseudomonas sp. NPDC089734]|uniref:MFS transporter n=1 Tax=Pseudomonas sp. NPDC089734 TaxID=3364469 RepID=UPI003800EDCC
MNGMDVSRLGVLRLGVAQLINWGVTFYLPGAFGQAIADDLGWSGQRVFAGLSVAMLVMGLVSPFVARLIRRLGARQVLQLGALLNALGCCGLASCQSPVPYFMAWAVLGGGMRLSLYDALFAVLAGLLAAKARPLMIQITLLGGLASAVFWPLGHALNEVLGWRSGLGVYAALALFSGLLLSGLPGIRVDVVHRATETDGVTPWQRQAGYAMGMMLIGFMSAGLSGHLPTILAGFGVPVGLVALWGIGQTTARLIQALLAQSVPALRLNVWVGAGLTLCFVMALLSQQWAWLACLFIFGYGAMNGLGTLLRASLPFELFAHDRYTLLQGRLLAPGFLVSAGAPWFYAMVRESAGDRGLLLLSLGISLVLWGVAMTLRWHCRGTSF